MRFSRVVAAAVLIVGLAGSTASAQVQLTMHDGLVTIVASNATVRQILAEWARVGHTTIMNAERVPGGPITLQLTNVPEAQALDLLLRSISGYLAAPRAVTASNLSRYDRIVVMPTAAAPRQAVAAAPPVFQPQAVVPQPAEELNDDRPATTIVAPPQGPVFTTFQQPQVVGAPTAAPGIVPPAPVPGAVPPVPAQMPPGADQPASSTFPNATAPTTGTGVVGTPRPGMIIPPPTAPGQQPAQPGQ